MVHLIEVIGFSSPKSDPTFPGNGYSQTNGPDSHNKVLLFVSNALICSDARRRSHKFATFFLGPTCGATIRTYSGSAKAPPYVDKFRAHRNATLIEMQLAHSTLCVLTKVRGPYYG